MKDSDTPIYDSTRLRVPIIEDAVELFRYRDLVASLVRRDITVRYKRSALGFVWTMLNPLLTMLVMAIVFSTAFRFPIEHYPVYLLAGLLLWNFFAQSTSQAVNHLLWAGGLINKIYVPKSVFVVSSILVGLVNLMLALVPLALIMIVTGQPFSFALLFLPVPILLTFLFALGVGLFVTTLAVFFTDVIDIYQVALTVIMYGTPLFYPESIVPSKYLFFLHLNPMYYFVAMFRQPIYQGALPDSYILVRGVLVALVALMLGWWFFTNRARGFAYRV